MALRWYTVVVDCLDVAAQASWWRETLGWQTVYEADDEVVIVPAQVSEQLIKSTPWEQVAPGLVFVPVPEGKTVKNRLHIDLAPHTSDDRDAEIAALLERGAMLVDVGQRSDVSWTVLADLEGNEFCVPGRCRRAHLRHEVDGGERRDGRPPYRSGVGSPLQCGREVHQEELAQAGQAGDRGR